MHPSKAISSHANNKPTQIIVSMFQMAISIRTFIKTVESGKELGTVTEISNNQQHLSSGLKGNSSQHTTVPNTGHKREQQEFQSYGGGPAVSTSTNTFGMTPSQFESKILHRKNVSRVLRDQNVSGTPIIGSSSHFKGQTQRVGTAVPNSSQYPSSRVQMQSATTFSSRKIKQPTPLSSATPMPTDGGAQTSHIVDVFWKIHHQRRQRERKLEYGPARSKFYGAPKPVIGESNNQQLSSNNGDTNLLGPNTSQPHDESEYYSKQSVLRPKHFRGGSETQRSLERQRHESMNFWNGEQRNQNLRRNEWDLMDFFDQQEKQGVSRTNAHKYSQSMTSQNGASSAIISPSPEKSVPATNQMTINGPPNFDSLTKRSEQALKEQAAVRRVKKAKLNDLYFNSQVKELIFYQEHEEPQQSGGASIAHQRFVSVQFEKRNLASQNYQKAMRSRSFNNRDCGDASQDDQISNKSGYNIAVAQSAPREPHKIRNSLQDTPGRMSTLFKVASNNQRVQSTVQPPSMMGQRLQTTQTVISTDHE